MKKELKICLPVYKITYSVLFGILLSMVAGISDISQIGFVIVPNIAFLAIIFCADAYRIEYQEKRWEIFTLMPLKNRVKAVVCRLIIDTGYLTLIAYMSYACFYWQKPQNNMAISQVWLLGIFLLAVYAAILFWGILSMTLVNIFQNLWAGIGISVLLWLIVNSKEAYAVMGKYSVFAYVFGDSGSMKDFSWMVGSLTACLLAFAMLAGLPYLINKKARKMT